MESRLDVWASMLIWFFWLAVAIQTSLAIRAALVEAREGMLISRNRVILLSVIFVASTALALAMTLIGPLPQTSTQSERTRQLDKLPQESQIEAKNINDQLTSFDVTMKHLEDEQKQIDTRRRLLRDSQVKAQQDLRKLGVTTPMKLIVANKFAVIDRQRRVEFGLGGMVVLMLAAIFALTLSGQFNTLFPDGIPFTGKKGIDQAKLRTLLDELAALTEKENYREALLKAKGIPEKRLRPLDTLDLLFLRSFCSVMLVAFPSAEDSREQRTQMLAAAIGDLEFVSREAPKREEAVYTLAIAYGLEEQYQQALQRLDSVAAQISTKMKPQFEHNQGVCCLKLAEVSLTQGMISEAERFYERASTLGQQAGLVVQSRLRLAMLDLRTKLNRKDLDAASSTLTKIAAMANLDKKQRDQVHVVNLALNGELALQRDDPQAALRECDTFLSAHLPSDLPELNSDLADETFSMVMSEDLPFAPSVYQNFLFIRAVALSRLQGARLVRPSESQVNELAAPLLRGLQLAPRQRDLLGALGGLYCWFRREEISRGRQWLEAAIIMGAKGRLIRIILEHDRMIEQQRGTALDWFRSASSRFLRDPMLASEVRDSLVQELGRFQEFESMLMQLQEKPPIESEEPTVQALRDRAAYIGNLVANVIVSVSPERSARLSSIRDQYAACLQNLDQNTQIITTLERQVFAELADTLVLR